MGANIGTTITSALVSLTQAGDRERFRRAVTAATVHDSFNWLTVLVLLPIEVVTGMSECSIQLIRMSLTSLMSSLTPFPTAGYLRRVSGLLVQQLPLHTFKNANFDLLKMITGPLTHRIVMVCHCSLQNSPPVTSSSSCEHVDMLAVRSAAALVL